MNLSTVSDLCLSLYLPPPLPLSLYLSLRDQSLTDIIPLYNSMKKTAFSDSEDEVCVCDLFVCVILLSRDRCRTVHSL